jgi:N-acyl-D-amino-acid deacylase
LTLEQAIHKMTYLGAQHVGIQKRGLIRPGYYADLVFFDPAVISDRSDLSDPKAISTGIGQVWINGRITFKSGSVTTNRPGVFLTR